MVSKILIIVPESLNRLLFDFFRHLYIGAERLDQKSPNLVAGFFADQDAHKRTNQF